METRSMKTRINLWLSEHPDFIFDIAFFGLMFGAIKGAIVISPHFVWMP